MTTTSTGAAWAHGEPPPWMQPPPGFDECDAADQADDLAAALLADWLGDRGAQLAERFGPVDEAVAELRNPRAAVVARRRRILDDALRSPATPPLSRSLLEAPMPPSTDAIARHRQILDDALQPTRPPLGRSTLYAPMRPTADDAAAAEYRRHAA